MRVPERRSARARDTGSPPEGYTDPRENAPPIPLPRVTRTLAISVRSVCVPQYSSECTCKRTSKHPPSNAAHSVLTREVIVAAQRTSGPRAIKSRRSEHLAAHLECVARPLQVHRRQAVALIYAHLFFVPEHPSAPCSACAPLRLSVKMGVEVTHVMVRR